MALLRWTGEFELGLPEVDAQHHRLVAILNALDAGLRKGYSLDILGSILDDLTRYTLVHFTYEERLMDEQALPDMAGHRHAHEEFADAVVAFKTRFDTGQADLSAEVLQFLRDWLAGHILGSDRELVEQYLAASAHPQLAAG